MKEARELRGMNQTQLSEASGVDAATISALEKRDNKTSVYAVQIAAALKVSLPDLLAGRVVPLLNSNGTLKEALQDEASLRAVARFEIERALNALTIVGDDKAEILDLVDKCAARSAEYHSLFMKSVAAKTKAK